MADGNGGGNSALALLVGALLVIVLRAPKGIVGLIVSRSMERKR